MPAEPLPLTSLIESLADGREIDWAAVEATPTDGSQQRSYRNLRLIARLADLHRTLSFDSCAETPALAAAASLPGGMAGDRWGHLELVERIGAGAFGEVFRARDAQLQIDVALKVLRVIPSSQD